MEGWGGLKRQENQGLQRVVQFQKVAMGRRQCWGTPGNNKREKGRIRAVEVMPFPLGSREGGKERGGA